MNSQPGSAPRTAPWLMLAFALLFGLGTGTAWLLARMGAQRPIRILLVTPVPAPDSGLDPEETRAIGSFIQDHLECYGGYAVTVLTDPPRELGPLGSHPRTRLLVLNPRRQGDNLSLGFRLATAGSLIRLGPGAWHETKAAFLPPGAAFLALDGALGLAPEDRGSLLTPADASDFWSLTKAAALRLRNTRLEEAARLAQQVVLHQPSCAEGWVLLGNLHYRRYLNDPKAFSTNEADLEAPFRRALQLLPGLPRAAFLLSLMRSDSGDQKGALDLLASARRIYPRNPTLLTGIAYAARGAGLLPLARRALDLRDSLAFSDYLPQAVDITRLYTGQIDRFEASLQDQPGHLRNLTGVLPFYRGYLALIRGDRAAAQIAFEEARQAPKGYPAIVQLAEVYEHALEGRRSEAWSELRALDQVRTGMREPDGEFTIRLAEAYAFLGDRDSAMDMAARAFARGFGCTDWYEKSPMLQPLRDLPKWQALLQHLRERQALMASAFPPSLVENPS